MCRYTWMDGAAYGAELCRFQQMVRDLSRALGAPLCSAPPSATLQAFLLFPRSYRSSLYPLSVCLFNMISQWKTIAEHSSLCFHVLPLRSSPYGFGSKLPHNVAIAPWTHKLRLFLSSICLSIQHVSTVKTSFACKRIYVCIHLESPGQSPGSSTVIGKLCFPFI